MSAVLPRQGVESAQTAADIAKAEFFAALHRANAAAATLLAARIAMTPAYAPMNDLAGECTEIHVEQAEEMRAAMRTMNAAMNAAIEIHVEQAEAMGAAMRAMDAAMTAATVASKALADAQARQDAAAARDDISERA